MATDYKFYIDTWASLRPAQ